MRVKTVKSIVPLIVSLCAATAGHAESFDCLVNPSTVLKIGSPISSTLQSVSVDRGSLVRKGQELARLESSVEQASVALRRAQADNFAEILARRARLEAAQQEVVRVSHQVEGFSISGQKAGEVRTALRVAEQDLALSVLGQQVAQLELDRASAQLEQRVIRSPINGIVTERLLGPGEYVHPDTHIVVLAAIDPLYVEVYPPVRFFTAIKPGDTASIRIDAPVEGQHAATVTVVDRLFDAGSGTFGVRLQLPNANNALPAGARCRATFDLDPKPGRDPATSE